MNPDEVISRLSAATEALKLKLEASNAKIAELEKKAATYTEDHEKKLLDLTKALEEMTK